MYVRSTMASTGRRPQLSTQEATELARTFYGLHATARPLPGYCDQNVLLTADDGAAFVLKIAHAEEERDVLEAQHALLKRLGTSSVPVPGVCSTQDGETITSLAGAQGSRHLVRMLTYLPGTPLAKVHPHPRALLEDLGRCLGQMSIALDGFDHPALHRHLTWDLQHAPETIHTHLDAVNDPQRRALVARYLAAFEHDTIPLLATLRRSIIHGDANDYNVLVSPADRADRAVVGVIDFGDAVYSYTVAEVAIAAAYAMLSKQDPVAAAAAIAAGYHSVYPLTEHEVEALFPLITMRLCTSVCMAAVQKARDPDNEYLAVSEQPAWDLLERLAAVPPRLAHYRLRHACGWPPCPQVAAITCWLQAHRSQAAPVVRPGPHEAPVVVFDFSVGSTEWSQAGLMQPLMAGETISACMQAADDAIGVGRYDEARLVYAADQFADVGGERRTIHIGLDLFQEAGAPVFAPFDAVIHSIADNDRPLDYGPTIILQHEPDDGPVFFTLYGHLSRASLDGLAAGQPIRKGQQIGTLGTPGENGGWAPHLHLQVIADMLGYAGDFPGVAPPSQRAVWTNLCPDPNLLLGIPATAFPAPKQTADQILKARRQHFGKNLGLSYQVPLHIVCGFRQHLYDAEGRSYLDGVNNVCHVGHSHLRVVEALARQAAVLNTNTRYLHENLVLYAERLTATLPEPLRVCFFVNSGSEANDLALRLAYAYTGRRDVIVLDGAYHGHLSSLVDISPYKFDGPGGSGRPPQTHVVPMPDPYRGRYRRDDPEAGPKYAAHVREAVEQSGGVAACLAESLLSCGGQIVLPQGFLAEAYRHVRAGGGVCIADEVQVGLGRVGTHMWGFETQGVVPDVVTMGKPLGNGHPLAAVVTTDAIAASFATGMEYFNTFGGNPVSCAVGLAVLEVMEEERLQAHALRTGTYLMDGLAGLMEHHPIIGDVRGSGLFIGVELVRDRKTLEPAAAQAAYLVNRAREHGVLLSTDGPLHNVIKIKPPLVFDEADAARVIDTLDGILAEDFCRQQDA